MKNPHRFSLDSGSGPSIETKAENAKGGIKCNDQAGTVDITLSFDAVMYLTVGKNKLKLKSESISMNDSGTIAYRDCCCLK